MPQRRAAILDELRRNPSHPTASELLDRVRRSLPSITLATVYRNLGILEDLGLVRQVGTGTSPARFDAATKQHLHARCVQCGRVADLPLATLPNLLRPAQDASDFLIRDYTIVFEGICPQCRKTGTDAPSDTAATLSSPSQERAPTIP